MWFALCSSTSMPEQRRYVKTQEELNRNRKRAPLHVVKASRHFTSTNQATDRHASVYVMPFQFPVELS